MRKDMLIMEPKYIRPSKYAKIVGLTPLTIRKKFHQGKIKGKQDKDTNAILLLNPNYKEDVKSLEKRAILYARVSSSTNKKSLDGQIERLRNYASAKGYIIVDEVREIASGLNDHRSKFVKLLKRNDYNILLAEHKDRITRFGYNYLSILLARCGIQLQVINQIDNKDQELLDDFISLVTSFCNRIYGRRRKDKTQKIIKNIQHENQVK